MGRLKKHLEMESQDPKSRGHAGATPGACAPTVDGLARPAPSEANAGMNTGGASISKGTAVEAAGAPIRSQEIAALVDRVEASLKGDVPSLTLRLGSGAVAARVELKRTGNRQVALHMEAGSAGVARLGEAREAIRSALAERGIRLGNFAVS